MGTLIREIVVEKFPWKSRIMVLENGKAVDFSEFDPSDDRDLGTIFKGKVQKVLPNMKCAFVDIGQEKNAILYFSDLLEENNLTSSKLKKGQDLLVQVLKQATGDKGPRVTENITLPGRLLVLMPFRNELRISRKITGDSERESKRTILKNILPDGMGAIARTAIKTACIEEIKAEVFELLNVWKEIEKYEHSGRVPSIVHREADGVEKMLREYLDGNTKVITVNDEDYYGTIRNYVEVLPVENRPKIILSKGAIFEQLGLTREIRRSNERRVWLKCGGYLVFDQTEAMMVIDVNSGRFTSNKNHKDFETTVLQINSEAAEEIARQLRLRGVGGMILIDFIDMETEEFRQRIVDKMKDGLAGDKEHTKVLGFTQLGILEVTRHKTRRAILENNTTECVICGGAGRIVSLKTHSTNLKSELINASYLEGNEICCKVHPDLFEEMQKDLTSLKYIENTLKKKIVFESDRARHWSEYEIHSR